jgi:ketosteroid isomerase-like protein
MPTIRRVALPWGILVWGLVTTTACQAPVDVEKARADLLEADARYTAVMDAGDVEGIVALYAADATRYPPNGDPTHGLDAMRRFAEGVASTPGFSLTATPLALEVAESGEMGYTLSLLELTVTGAEGEASVQHLRDFHVWRRDASGAWRIVEDIWHVLQRPDAGD